MTTVLTYRFSAFGDVLLTIPAIMGTLKDNDDLRIVMLTRKQFALYFPCHERLRVVGLDFEGESKNIFGLIGAAKQVRKSESIDYIADLHSVIRSYILDIYFFLSGHRIRRLKKNRRARRRYIKGKSNTPLPMIIDEYCRVFTGLGFHSSIVNHPLRKSEYGPEPDVGRGPVNSMRKPRIGFAPFTRHASKSWPASYSQQLIDILSDRLTASIFLFGSGDENDELAKFSGSDLTNLSGKLSPDDEIKMISSLDLMISMDSANMHLANLVGIPVISIWGGTDPNMGFKPYSQASDNIIEPPLDLLCRPCSVYGTSKCKRQGKPFICLTSISPETVAKKTEIFLDK